MDTQSLIILATAVFTGLFGMLCVAVAYETEFSDSIIGFNIHQVSLALAATSLYTAGVLGIVGIVVVVLKEMT